MTQIGSPTANLNSYLCKAAGYCFAGDRARALTELHDALHAWNPGSQERLAFCKTIDKFRGHKLGYIEMAADAAEVGCLVPKTYEQRVVEITVGGATPEGERPAWAVQVWDICTCPNCEDEAHWAQFAPWFDSKEQAEAFMNRGAAA